MVLASFGNFDQAMMGWRLVSAKFTRCTRLMFSKTHERKYRHAFRMLTGSTCLPAIILHKLFPREGLAMAWINRMNV